MSLLMKAHLNGAKTKTGTDAIYPTIDGATFYSELWALEEKRREFPPHPSKATSKPTKQ